MNKIIKAEKQANGMYKVTYIDDNNKTCIVYMTEQYYKTHTYYKIRMLKEKLETQGCDLETLESFEKVVRKDAEEEYSYNM